MLESVCGGAISTTSTSRDEHGSDSFFRTSLADRALFVIMRTTAWSDASCTESAQIDAAEPSNASTRSKSLPTLLVRKTLNCVTVGGEYPRAVSIGVPAC